MNARHYSICKSFANASVVFICEKETRSHRHKNPSTQTHRASERKWDDVHDWSLRMEWEISNEQEKTRKQKRDMSLFYCFFFSLSLCLRMTKQQHNKSSRQIAHGVFCCCYSVIIVVVVFAVAAASVAAKDSFAADWRHTRRAICYWQWFCTFIVI